MEVFLHPASWIALLTLSVLEIILGIDNILFVSIVTNKLPADIQNSTRTIGLSLALIFRIGLLIGINWLVSVQHPLFTLFDISFSIRDLILLAGGFFLLIKTISEIYKKVELDEDEASEFKKGKKHSQWETIGLIIVIDMVFSFDSILTAVGMVNELILMIVAVVLAMIVMITFVNQVSKFINDHPSVQMLAMSFLILIAFVLILDGLHEHIERGYVYFAFFFSLAVEFLNLRRNKKKTKTQTHQA